MTAPSESFSGLWRLSLKASQRTRAEQWVGLGIFLILNLGFLSLNNWIAQFSVQNNWQTVFSWAPVEWILKPLWMFIYFSQSMGVWMLWRLGSLKALKLEISLYLSQFPLAILWSLSFFIWHQILLALVMLLLLFTATLLSTIVFWKKDTLSGQWMLPSLLWVGFTACLNMAMCMLTN